MQSLRSNLYARLLLRFCVNTFASAAMSQEK